MYKNPLSILLRLSFRTSSVVVAILVVGSAIAAKKHQLDADLRVAAKEGNVTLIRKLLERGATLNVSGPFTSPPLSLSAGHGHLAASKFLVMRGARVNAQGAYGRTALMAASSRHLAVVKYLLSAGADLEIKDQSGKGDPALVYAIRGKQANITRYLLSQGAVANHGLWAATHLACESGSPVFLDLLVAYKANINFKTPRGTALHRAGRYCYRQGSRVMAYLLKRGADAKVKNASGETALLLAAYSADLASVKLLLAHGADLHGKDNKGNGVLHSLCNHGAMSEKKTGEPLALAQFLIEKGARTNATNKNGETVLMRATLADYAQIARLLLSRGARPDARDSFKQTALMLAAARSVKLAEILISAGADINARSNQGATALFVATRHCHVSMVDYLIAHGANVNLKGPGGTPLSIAQDERNARQGVKHSAAGFKCYSGVADSLKAAGAK